MRNSIHYSQELLFLLAELSRAVRFCRQDAVFCEGVSFTQFLILDAIAEGKGVTMTDLNTILSIEKSTGTRLVKPLIDKNLVERKQSDKDRRAVLLELTQEGIATHRRVWDCFIGFAETIKKEIPEDKSEQVRNALRIFARAVRTASSACTCCDLSEGLTQ